MSGVNTFVFLIALSSAGQVHVLEGDETLVSMVDGKLGLRFDEEENDLADVMRQVGLRLGEVNGTLVLFTTFEDIGRGGRAYSVPIYNETYGTGLDPIDRRAEFGASRFVQLVNMKSLDGYLDRAQLLNTLSHQLAHRHLAYASSPLSVPLVGRQDAHWHAALSTEGSLMGGYGWEDLGDGSFEVIAVNERFSPLDLYLLGVLSPQQVAPFFFIDELRTLDGFALPDAAILQLGDRALGTRVDVTIDDVIRQNGPREQERGDMEALFVLLTAPGERETSTTVQATLRDLVLLRREAEETFSDLGGRLCVGIDCNPPFTDAVIDESCGCTSSRGRGGASLVSLFLLLGLYSLLAQRSSFR